MTLVPGSTTADRSHRGPSTPRTIALTLVAAVVMASAVNSVIAFAAISAGADPAFGPLGVGATTGYSALGVLAGFIGWIGVRRFVPRPATVLAALVPVLTLASFVPDLMFFDPASRERAGPTAAIALMLMHVAVVAVAVPVYRRVAPVGA